VPFGYLAFTCLIAVGTWFALFPVRRLAGVSYWFELVLNELPFLAFYLLLASTLLAFGQGDIDTPGGWAVVALAALTAVGLGVLVLRARPTRDLPWAHILLAPLWVRRRDVRRIANLSYGPAGKRNLLDVYHRRDRPTGGPVVVYAHGGSFRSGRKNREARLLLYRLASQGWVCLSINYRLKPQAAYPEFHQDFAKAIGWARETADRFGGNATTLFLSGSSAGAHMAAMSALTDRAVAGALCFYGYYGQVDGTPASAPTAHLGPNAPPFFLAHGDHDTLVPVEMAREFVEAMRRTSDSGVAYLELPGAQHSFDLFRSIRNEQVVRQAVDFTDRVRAARVADGGAKP
jgi:acetyl esterase/lipase